MVAVTLEVTEEELFFQFGMDNWSAYVDQVSPPPRLIRVSFCIGSLGAFLKAVPCLVSMLDIGYRLPPMHCIISSASVGPLFAICDFYLFVTLLAHKFHALHNAIFCYLSNTCR